MTTGNKARLVILISGRGSNMRSLIEAAQTENLQADIVAVVSNCSDAAGLGYAAEQGIDTAVVDHKQFTSRELFDLALASTIDEYNPDYVILAGFMRILTADFVEHYANRLINIHPSLLPKFKGLHTHERVIEAGDTEHGATVHFVTAQLDDGPIILQATVPVLKDDDAGTLAARVLEQEHLLYPAAIQKLVMQQTD